MADLRVPLEPGIVYILRNSAFTGTVVKIGRTSREPEVRAAELLSGTGVPNPFEVLYQESVVDTKLAERLIHEALAEHRVHERREFFDVPLKDAVRVVFRTCMQVNRSVLHESSRLAVVFEGPRPMGAMFDLLKASLGGRTYVRLILSRERASGEIDLGEKFLVRCTPELISALGRIDGVTDVQFFRSEET